MIQFHPSKAPVFLTYKIGDEITFADFVRFSPHSDMTDSEIAELKTKFEEMGAVVKILPRERKRKAVSKTKTKSVSASDPRTTVRTLVSKSTSKNKLELEEECQRVMDECKV
jgi:hypothetical protein